MEKPKYYITTAIAYTSGKPHIGNTYEIVLADAIARYKRSKGFDVFFQTGTDEHGQKIELKAEEAGVTPKEFVDNVAGEIKKIWDLMNTSYDKFIRTTDEDHERQVQKIFKKMYEKGDIYKGYYEGMYCTPCESFFTESQLVDGKCPDCGRPVQPAREEAYFFKMSKYADRLIEPNLINFSIVIGSGNFLIVTAGPSNAMGGRTMCTRDPSGSLASATGRETFTVRLTRLTIC